MHSQTILHLVPDKGNPRAISVLAHPDNEKYVSLSSPRPRREDGQGDKEDDGPKLGLEIGYHVPLRPRPEVIVEVGRNADLILPASSISSVHFSFETHPESKVIMFHDRSRHRNTKIDPFGFRTDGHIRQLVLQPGIIYRITAGGEKSDLYRFELRWAQMKGSELLEKIGCGYQVARERAQNPRWARTIEDGPTELSSWYNTRLHTPTNGGVQRTTEGERLGEGAFGKVMKAIDLDSGYPIAVKKIALSRTGWPAPGLESAIRREVKILSSLSHRNIVEYLGSAGWGTGTTSIYTSLKAGNVNHLLEKFPAVRSHHPTLTQLTRQMLEALDYLAFRGLCHRDVKPDNILYMPINECECIFQLADFGFATQIDLARTHCGSAMFMAPELYFHTHPQTPKLDVWSLFVTIISINRTAGFDDRELKHYEEVVQLVKIAATVFPYLSPMAREDPELRASASQMLVQCFASNGLTTPRGRVMPIPFLYDGPSRLQALPSSVSQPVNLAATRKRDSLRPSRQIAKRWGTGRFKPAQYQPRKEKMRARGPYWHS